jgi:hypothetical protein
MNKNNAPVICKDCGYEMGWHDEYGMLSEAFGGMAPCVDASKYKSKDRKNEKRDEDKKDAPHNPS